VTFRASECPARIFQIPDFKRYFVRLHHPGMPFALHRPEEAARGGADAAENHETKEGKGR
jgi:hypothetical protein